MTSPRSLIGSGRARCPPDARVPIRPGASEFTARTSVRASGERSVSREEEASGGAPSSQDGTGEEDVELQRLTGSTGRGLRRPVALSG